MKRFLFYTIFIIALASCGASRHFTKQSFTPAQAALADSILRYALDHEALYTLADTLKPISSVKYLDYKIAKDSSQKDGDAFVVKNLQYLDKVETYQQVCNQLSRGDWLFVLMPFENVDKGQRNITISVVRRSSFAKMLLRYAPFFGQWGFAANADPATVLPVIEYETQTDRFRGYGYMFGYPQHAVDFFVEAAKTQKADKEKKLVPRDFFAIPVYAGDKGYFTYATPKGYIPQEVDNRLLKNAGTTLEKYKSLRKKYETTAGVKAFQLWKAMNK